MRHSNGTQGAAPRSGRGGGECCDALTVGCGRSARDPVDTHGLGRERQRRAPVGDASVAGRLRPDGEQLIAPAPGRERTTHVLAMGREELPKGLALCTRRCRHGAPPRQ